MWNIAEYVRSTIRPELRPAERMPWQVRLGPGLYLLKDDSFLRLVGFQGKNPADMTDESLFRAHEKLNAAMRAMDGSWAAWIEARNVTADTPAYLAENLQACENDASYLLTGQQIAPFASGNRRELQQVLSLQWRPPSAVRARMDRMFETGGDEETESVDELAAQFIHDTDALVDLFSPGVESVWQLDQVTADTFLYFAATLLRGRVDLGCEWDISEQIGIVGHSGGTKPDLGDFALRGVNVHGWPRSTKAAMLHELLSLGIEFRFVTRWIAYDEAEAKRKLSTIWNRASIGKKTFSTYVAEWFNKSGDGGSNNPDGVARSDEAYAAREDLASGEVSFGKATISVLVWDADPKVADEKSKEVEKLLNQREFSAIEDRYHAQEVWLGSLPGHPYPNVARCFVKSRNFAHAAPILTPWTGPDDGRALYTGSTPSGGIFRLRLHHGDVGHTLVAGPTGTGKSILLSAKALGWAAIEPDGQVIIVDKGRSARAATLCAGGDLRDIGADGMCFQPLADVDTSKGKAAAFVWLSDFLADRKVTVDTALEKLIADKLELVAHSPREERTLSLFRSYLPPGTAKDALRPFCLGGDFGHLFDGNKAPDLSSSWLCLEMGALMEDDMRPALVPALSHIFQLIERKLDGRPTLIILDEAWTFLENTSFGARIGKWLREARKKGGAVILASQAANDVLSSRLAPVILDSCLTRIYLPNEAAQQSAEFYARVGLSPAQVAVIGSAVRKRQYIYHSETKGFGVFELGLGDLGLALCGGAAEGQDTVKNHQLIDRVLAAAGTERFLPAWLEARGLGWAAELIHERKASYDLAAE